MSTFAHLSNVYKYLEQYGIMGHQIGRKVGDMLEVVTMATLAQDAETLQRMQTEPSVLGFTEAAHKVEFAFYNSEDSHKCVGLVECKKVGVEVTKHGKTKRKPLVLLPNKAYTHSMRPRWVANPPTIKVVNRGEGKLETIIGTNREVFEVKPGDRLKFVVTQNAEYKVVGPHHHLAELTANLGACHIFTIHDTADGSVSFNIDTCLTGPQTIEKAKQIAWVALDVRKKECNHWGKEDVTDAERSFKAILVIGESSHWEIKSRKVVRAALDYNFIVTDELLVELFKKFIAEFGIVDFEEAVSKARYVSDPTMKQIVDDVVAAAGGKVLADMDTGKFCTIRLRDNALLVEPIS